MSSTQPRAHRSVSSTVVPVCAWKMRSLSSPPGGSHMRQAPCEPTCRRGCMQPLPAHSVSLHVCRRLRPHHASFSNVGLPGDMPKVCNARQGWASGAPVTVMSSFAAKTGPSASISFIRASIFVGSPSGALLSRSATRRTLLQRCAHRLEDDTKTQAPRKGRKGGKCENCREATPEQRAWARTRDERVHQVGDIDPAQQCGRGVALLGHRLLLQVLQVGADDDGRAQDLRPVELLPARSPSAWSIPSKRERWLRLWYCG